MNLDNYDPIVSVGNTVYTSSAVFDVNGDVSIVTSESEARKRSPHNHHHHEHHYTHFHGHGGCMTYSSHHSSGFSSGTTTGSYPSSLSPCSAFGTPHDGFTFTSDIIFGHDHHHHGHNHYLFTTHGNHYHSPGSSLCYNNHHLTFHVHEHHGHHDHHHHDEHHHHEVKIDFHPQPGHTYTVTATYRLVVLVANQSSWRVYFSKGIAVQE